MNNKALILLPVTQAFQASR